jgi:hypothetical protein
VTAVTASELSESGRQARQRQVEALLTELDERRRRLYRLRAYGVQFGGLRDLKDDVREVRERLRDAVAAAGR